MNGPFASDGSARGLEPHVYGDRPADRAGRPAQGVPLGLILLLIVMAQALVVATFVAVFA